MAPELAAQIAALGRIIDPAATAALYAPLHMQVPDPGMRVNRDLAYGPGERQLLDVFGTSEPGVARPVLVFVHGGGFTGGNKHMPGTPFYDNIGLWAMRAGLVGVNMTYPLAPAATWPSASENVARALRWVRTHIAEHGGDPSRIFLYGHSAGATHAATYVAFADIHGPDGPRIAGLILSSGIYDFTTFPFPPGYQSYVGTDASLYAARSPLSGLAASAVPKMLAAAEFDPPPFVAQFDRLTSALREAADPQARALVLPQHSHLSLTYAIGTDDTAWTGAIAEFIRTA